MARVKRLPANGNGQDFVVGDIHGHFDTLEALLNDAEFDRARDRLFSTGDLIDRGPDSTKALWYLQRPWFHCVLGNHEQLLLQSAVDNELSANWQMFNGGAWWTATDTETRERFLRDLPELPLVLEIETEEGVVGIVHADVPGDNWGDFVAAVEAGDTEVCDRALWSRDRIYLAVADGDPGEVSGIREIIVGHTPVQRPISFHNVTYLDTGAGHKLSGAALSLRRLVGNRECWTRSTVRLDTPSESTG